MASTLTVPVTSIRNVRPHPNADKLDLCDVLGFQMAIPKGRYKNDDAVVYIPADTLLTDEWAEKFGVKNFLRGKDKNRVGRIKLRGEPSFGLVVDIPEDQNWNDGDNVADYFGCTKYEPPIRATAGDAAAYDENINPFVYRYTDIENGKIYTDVFKDGEEVIATEKLHGTNGKLISIKGVGIAAGSMSILRKRPDGSDGTPSNFDSKEMKENTYWHPWTIEGVRGLMDELTKDYNVVTLYGEIFGGSIQSLNYGIPKGQGIAFRAFDISVNDKYLHWDDFEVLCKQYDVPMVPVLYRGPYSMEKMKEVADGNSTLEGADHIREGIVVKPQIERTDPKIGRAVLKYISTEYELSKHKERDTTDI